MKLEPNKFYILNNGQLMHTFKADGYGRMIGAIMEDDSPQCWDGYAWDADTGAFGAQSGVKYSKRLDVCEAINARAAIVSYMKATDYCATYENDEPDDDGNMRQGFGATEIDAVMDLLANYPGEERAETMTRRAA